MGTPTASAARTDAMVRWYPLWDAYYAAVYVVVLVVVLRTDGLTGWQRATGIAVLTVWAWWYAVAGRLPLVGPPTVRRGSRYVVGMTVLLVIAMMACPPTAFALFAYIPMVFTSISLVPAAVLALAANLFPALQYAAYTGGWQGLVQAQLPWLLLSVLGAVVIALWISKVAGQSRQRAELIEQLEATRAEVQALSHRAGVAAERERLAGEIHDTLAQGFTSILTLLQAARSNPGSAARHLELAELTARENLAQARELVAGRGPAELGAGSLSDAVRRRTERTGQELGVPARFAAVGESRALPMAVEVVLLRAAQEALGNVCKHARPGRVAVTLDYAEDEVRLDVTDDGAGFDAGGSSSPGGPDCSENGSENGTANGTGGYGLRGMRSRVRQVGGELAVRSVPGEGTSVTVRVAG